MSIFTRSKATTTSLQLLSRWTSTKTATAASQYRVLPPAGPGSSAAASSHTVRSTRSLTRPCGQRSALDPEAQYGLRTLVVPPSVALPTSLQSKERTQTFTGKPNIDSTSTSHIRIHLCIPLLLLLSSASSVPSHPIPSHTSPVTNPTASCPHPIRL